MMNRSRLGSRFIGWMTCASVVATLLSTGAMPTLAAVDFTTAHSPVHTGFDSLLATDDLIAGMIPIELPGDNGWHPANPASTNGSLDPSGLPTFTDGVGGSGLMGLLNDYPLDWDAGGGNPTKLIEYEFGSPVDIGRINILTGNSNNSDGRIFSTTVIEYSTDGINFNQLGYFQSDPSGTINNMGVADPQAATFVSIFDDASATMLSGVTYLDFFFYAVDNTQGQMQDPFGDVDTGVGVNTFTGTDDTFAAAFESPLVWEIDVLAPSEGLTGDHNLDGTVDAADYALWRSDPNSYGGDPQGYNDWVNNFGATLGSGAGGGIAASIPEPNTLMMLFAAVVIGLTRRARTFAGFE